MVRETRTVESRSSLNRWEPQDEGEGVGGVGRGSTVDGEVTCLAEGVVDGNVPPSSLYLLGLISPMFLTSRD